MTKIKQFDSLPLNRRQSDMELSGFSFFWCVLEEINQFNLEEKLWPRGAAFAERMWSESSLQDTDELAPRLARVYCKMLARGAHVSPIGPGTCEHW
eukprot:m.98618 g.98618  ORF g.98618 m.98618 type:complete len:96 (+) comp18575_c0_seq2:406-693(+)